MSSPVGVRVGMISQWYDPERGSAALSGVIARRLRAEGLSIRVLTGFPNYPEGKIYPGYRQRLLQRETYGGVQIARTPLWANHSTSVVPRLGNYLSFAASASLGALRVLRSSDVSYVFCTPATVGIPALLLRKLCGVPYVLQIQDLWPDSVTASGFLNPGLARLADRVLNAYCDALYRSADHITVISPGMVERIVARGIPRTKVSFISNWADEAVFRPADRNADLAAEIGITAPFNVMYAGNLGEYQELPLLLEAAALLKDHADIGFVIVGGGVVEARLREMAEGLGNVVFIPAQPMDQMGKLMALGDLHYVSLADKPLFRITLPSKLQATMAAGRAIIGALTGDAADAVRAAGAGVVLAERSARALAAAIVDFRENPERVEACAKRARQYYLQHYSEQVSARRLARLLRTAAGKGRRR